MFVSSQQEQKRVEMKKMHAKFNDRVGQVIYTLFLLGGSATATAIARRCGISQSYASRILNYLEDAQMVTHSRVFHRKNVYANHYYLHPEFEARYFNSGYHEAYRKMYIKTMSMV